jgi:seryl-tRNA synthetase
MRQGNDADQDELERVKAQSTEAAEMADKADAELAELEAEQNVLLAGIPNLLDDLVPDGDDDKDNQVVSTWGSSEDLKKKLEWPDNFVPKWHDDVASGVGGYQAEAAVQMSGSRFVALSGDVARLERAIGMFFVDMHVKNGYTEVSVPFVVSRSALEGTSQLPKFQEDLFAIKTESHTCNGEDAYLIPTAEVPVTNLHRDSVLEEADLPKKYVAWTPCFRAEAGSYGRDTKGLIRTHQFGKVELVKITSAETSDDEHEALTRDAEACLQALALPYRKVRLCSGDIGFSARHCYDLEVWLPGAAEYREISSCSNTGDFQARRMGLRYRPSAAEEGDDGKKKAKKPKPVLCHTINGSGLAVGRTLVAVLENYQMPDGSIVIPDVLQPYMGGQEVIRNP